MMMKSKTITNNIITTNTISITSSSIKRNVVPFRYTHSVSTVTTTAVTTAAAAAGKVKVGVQQQPAQSTTIQPKILFNDQYQYQNQYLYRCNQRLFSSSSLLSSSSSLLMPSIPSRRQSKQLQPQQTTTTNTSTNNVMFPTNANGSIRSIQSEREYLSIVTQTFETIHDTIDTILEAQTYITDYEITYVQGVLTMKFPPHGTWVLNQQTPNLQIWWSSPLSGPKRFEYDDKDQLWFSTKDGLNLGHALSQEIHHIYPYLDLIDLKV